MINFRNYLFLLILLWGAGLQANVRNFERDVKGITPNLVLIMYGLNDQAAFSPLNAYLEQYEWLLNNVRERFNADSIFLQPTPHIDIINNEKQPEKKIRVIGFAAALKKLAAKLNVPCVDTFNALWLGDKDLKSTAMKMGKLFPIHYKRKYSTLLENKMKGDTIHPNATGHLFDCKSNL